MDDQDCLKPMGVYSDETRCGGMHHVLTVDELAALLRVDRKTAYEAIQRGEIPGIRRIGKAIRVARDAVLRWLAEGQDRVPRSRRTR